MNKKKISVGKIKETTYRKRLTQIIYTKLTIRSLDVFKEANNMGFHFHLVYIKLEKSIILILTTGK